MAIITFSRPNGGLLVVCILLCFLIPAFTFYGKPSLDYTHEVGSGLVAGLKSYGSWGDGNTKDPEQPDTRDKNYLAICLAVRDQSRDLPEFLKHHYFNMGVGHFYIMDDGSSPPLRDAKDTYGVPADALTFVYYDEAHRVSQMQYKMYDDCAKVHAKKRQHTWLAFIDADEFLDTPSGESLVDILRELEATRDDAGALAVNWQIHTSNGLLKRPASARWAYTHCIYDNPQDDGERSDNRHVKSIVRARDYGGPVTPHMFHLAPGKVTVGEDGASVQSHAWRQPITRDRVSLHHYAVKSREEYEEKMKRSNAMGQPKGWDFWNHIEHDLPHVVCEDMVRWLERDSR
ncbi:hypothetical protein KJ359_005264 [Pestalotiopsis sp. 9143b]|nr:hypothetical protein KJ359_005264 [Pestalotiopsis sp. 9143b]